MPSFATPTQQQIDAAVQRMRAPEFAAYFLSRLNNPKWVDPLDKQGIFDSPPSAVVADDGSVTFPNWPAAKYLVRMAALVPAEVATIMARLRTANVFVVADIIDAARVMPSSDAAQLVPAINEALRSGVLWLHVDDASKLCAELVQGGEVTAGLTLAEALFSPSPSVGDGFARWQDKYWYEKGMSIASPALVSQTANEWLPVLCVWLERVVRAKEDEVTHEGDDSSIWWRPAIESHTQNSKSDPRSILAGQVRHAFEEAIRGGHLGLADAFQILAGHSLLVFKRIRLHLLTEFAEQAPEEARQVIKDPALFDDHRYRHEYAELVGRRFELLTLEERAQWFALVDAGPDLSNVTDDEREGYLRYWQFKKLHLVRNHLDGGRKQFYERMLEEHGEPELADFNVYVTGGWGSGGSPYTVKELSTLPLEEAVVKVASWEGPVDQFRGPSLEGLANAFGEYVAANVPAFSADAAKLVGSPARYVLKFLTQMTEAVKAGTALDVLAVLGLCQWIVDQPAATHSAAEEQDLEHESRQWQWAREEVSRFCKSVVEARKDGQPQYAMGEIREPLWRIIQALARDPAESHIVHDITKDDPRGHDYFTLAINSPRGKALEAALEYARWVANHIKLEDDGHEVVPGGFEAMPEVRELLEWQIAPGNRTVQAMAIIGSRVGLIYWLDRDWLAARAAPLFDLEGLDRAPAANEGWAAWNAFLVWVRPHAEFYRIFKPQFAIAVVQSVNVAAVDESREHPMGHLAKHLVVLYARGELSLDDDGALLRHFMTSAHPDTRRYAFTFAGRVLYDEKDLPQAYVDRLRVLWDEYWSTTGKGDVEAKPDAMLFGMWFSSGRFEAEWALSRLEEFVQVAPVPEPDHEVIEVLAKIAATDIEKVVRILDRIVRADREGWRVGVWLDRGREILAMAMKAGGEARGRAERLIDHLGRRGFSDLGELLEIAPAGGSVQR